VHHAVTSAIWLLQTTAAVQTIRASGSVTLASGALQIGLLLLLLLLLLSTAF